MRASLGNWNARDHLVLLHHRRHEQRVVEHDARVDLRVRRHGREPEPDLRLVRRLAADRVVVHLERKPRAFREELPVALAPDHRFEAGRVQVHVLRAARPVRHAGQVGLGHRVMDDAAVARADLDRLHPDVAVEHEVGGIGGVRHRAGRRDRHRLLHRQHDVGRADLPALGERRRRRQSPPDCPRARRRRPTRRPSRSPSSLRTRGSRNSPKCGSAFHGGIARWTTCCLIDCAHGRASLNDSNEKGATSPGR